MKRSPLPKRAASLFRGFEQEAAKPKRCKACNELFTPLRMGQKACSPACALELAKSARLKRERREDKAKLEAMKPLGDLRKEAQQAFNAYIRERDKQAGHGCICCGAPLEWWSDIPGGKVDAGHYLSRGSSPELAFSEMNVNAQRKSCNRPGGTTRETFRAGMVARYGESAVQELEGPHPPQQLRHDDYRQIKATYRAKLRELRKD